MSNHIQFLRYVQDYIEANPEAGAYVSEYVANGIDLSRREALQRAADMEVALMARMTKGFRNRDALILGKLRLWQGKTCLVWDNVIEKMERVKS